MIDINDLARRISDPQARATMDHAIRELKNGSGRQLAQNISPDMAKRIERAAAAAQKGDKNAAMQAIGDVLSTPEGAALAKQLQFLIGK